MRVESDVPQNIHCVRREHMSISPVEQWLLYGDGTPTSRSLNEEQREAVTRMENTVTAAGAGSGKTFVLARRFAYLVCVRGYKVSEILTLTFTRKATSEMYERIYKTLTEIAQRFDDSAAKQAVDEFFTAKIQTLDSYCSYIIRMKAHSYGIRPDFSIDVVAAKEIAQQEVLPFILSHRNNPAIQDFARTTPLDQLAQDLFVETILEHSTVCEPIPFMAQLEAQHEFALDEWNKTAKQVESLVSQLGELYREFGAEKKTKFFKTLGDLLDSMRHIREPERDEYIPYCQYVQHFTSLSLSGQKPASNPCFSVVKELRDAYNNLASLAIFLDKYPLMQQLIPLLEEFQEKYNKKKCQGGILTFNDAARLALKILKECPEIRQAEKQAYRAIMIDEFQDDNALQKEMLYCLAEKLDVLSPGSVSATNLAPDKLFFVGDEKQSIYRFRGADVSVFRSLADELKSSTTEAYGDTLLNLSYNYRSQPDLIDAFNMIFGGISTTKPTRQEKGNEPPQNTEDTVSDAPNCCDGAALPAIFKTRMDFEDGTLPPYEAEYTRVLAGKTASENRTATSHVHLCIFDNKKEDEDNELQLSKQECEADFVAQKIKELIESEEFCPADVAILLRTKTHQSTYEKRLRVHGVPYMSDSIDGLFMDAPTNDIYNFLRLCVYPADQAAYGALLRSPFIALSHRSLQILAGNMQEQPFSTEQAELLDGDEKARYLRGCQIYKRIASTTGTQPIATTLSSLWYELGYRYETMWNDTVRQYSELYDILFELARQADLKGKSLVWFLDNLKEIESHKTKLENTDIPLERGNAIRIMTIHASKGLEFPIVFLCDAGADSHKNSNSKAAYLSRDWGITLNLPAPPGLTETKNNNFFFNQAKQEENFESKAELRRLLYVAMTRAEQELYVTGCFNLSSLSAEKNNDGADAGKQSSFIHMMMPLILHYTTRDDENITVNDGAPFNFESIPTCFHERVNDSQRECALQSSQSSWRNTPAQKARFAQNFIAIYQNAPKVSMPVIPSPYRTPSSFEPHLHFAHGESPDKASGIHTKTETPVSIAINDIVESTAKDDGAYGFSYADFGTAAHICLEAALNGTKCVLPSNLVQNLSKKHRQSLYTICEQMAAGFRASDIGKLALDASWRRTEYAFKYRIGGCILNGTMDLIFRMPDDSYTIIDYKTDSVEHPELYFVQQAAYRKAAAAILDCPETQVECKLYYLRTGNIVDITEECARIQLAELVAATMEQDSPTE